MQSHSSVDISGWKDIPKGFLLSFFSAFSSSSSSSSSSSVCRARPDITITVEAGCHKAPSLSLVLVHFSFGHFNNYIGYRVSSLV